MSIKNKFVTAITTAGLLAGLFGSAFVPAASASRAIDTDESYAFIHNDGNALDGYIGVSSNYSDGSLADCESPRLYNADCELPKRLQISSWVSYSNNLDDDNTVNGPTGETYGDDFSIGFYLETEGGAAIESTDLTATVSGGKVAVAFAYPANGRQRVPCYNPDLKGSFGTSGDSVNDVVSDGVDSREEDAGYYYLCVKAADEATLGTSNVVIKADGVTIWSGSIQVIGDLDEMDLSIRGGHPHVAADNDADSLFFKVEMLDANGQAICGTRDGFTNDCEDDALSFDVPDYVARGANPFDFFGSFEIGQDSEAGLIANACLTADEGETKTAAIRGDNYDGDQITSNTISIVCTEAQSKFVVAATGITQEYSNPTLSGEADWAGSAQGEDDATGAIEIYAVIKDSDGRLMGVDNSTGFLAAMNYTIDGNNLLFIDEEGATGLGDGNASGIGAGGKVVLGHYIPDLDVAAKFEIEVAFADGNGATAGNQAVAKSLYYLVSSLDLDYTLTRVRNASKTSATWTADWGLECSNAVVYFDWVNKNGTKGTLATGTSPIARRANFDGVATFTLKKRNMTIYVTAYACDDFSEDTDELGPVKARFR